MQGVAATWHLMHLLTIFFRNKKKGYLRNQVKSLIKLDFNLYTHTLTELNEQKFKFKTEDN